VYCNASLWLFGHFEVKELAEVLAVDFDDAEGIPKLKPDWRWEDEEQALLTSCSSLITTVETDDSRVVQFSHFSVKEYLTSERLATSSGDVSRYHIDLEPAHTILAQACMGILLRPDDRVEEDGVGKRSPLAGYAADTGPRMRSSRGCRRSYERRWNICLTRISHILRLGSNYTTSTRFQGVLLWNSQSLGHPALFPYTTRRCVDSKIL
jgi:hypothetical protein